MIYALLGALMIGGSLGLLGSGGSILTVPLLVYLVSHPEKQAVAESFAIVGSISLFGGLRAWRQDKVDRRSVLMWAPPGIVGAWLGVYLSKGIPGALQLLALGIVMLGAAASMLLAKPPIEDDSRKVHSWKVALAGLGIGVITGLVGIGGGFLIVPALVVITKTPMHRAIGTSLCVIAINCAASLAKLLLMTNPADLPPVDWTVVAEFIALGIAGSYAGAHLGKKLNQRMLKRIFAVFLIGLSIFVIWKQTHATAHAVSTGAAPTTPTPK